ncbi:MAG: HDOD domain-containing protein [Burkholderiaceae bacterium]
MAPSSFGQLILGYQLVWNKSRQPVAMQLFMAPIEGETLEAAHFLRAVELTWSGQSPTLVLTPLDARLLAGLLENCKPDGPWLSVQQDLLEPAGIVDLLRQAQQRGVQLLWRGAAGQRPDSAIAPWFARTIISLTPGETLVGAHVALKQGRDASPAASVAGDPVLPGQIVEAVPSRLMADHCLDQSGAWGIAGWPTDDILLSHKHQAIQPSHRAIVKLVRETDADLALDLLEHTLAEEPLLAYRFLRYTNSVALGLRNNVESLRHGLMLLGLTRFKQWLLEQMPLATNEPDMEPVHTAIVMRAHLMEHLLDAGDEDTLRREVFLTGMLSQVDGLLGEPLRDALHRLPLSERVTGAILGNSGPYAPFLELARALEYPYMDMVPALCKTHELHLDDVNRTMLRVMAQLKRAVA